MVRWIFMAHLRTIDNNSMASLFNHYDRKNNMTYKSLENSFLNVIIVTHV